MQNKPNSGSLRDGRSEGYTTWEAGTQTASTDSESAGPDGRKIGRADLEIVQIEPNHDMGYTDESVQLVSSPIGE